MLIHQPADYIAENVETTAMAEVVQKSSMDKAKPLTNASLAQRPKRFAMREQHNKNAQISKQV